MPCGNVTALPVLNPSRENSHPVVRVSTRRGEPSASQYPALENSTASAIAQNAIAAADITAWQRQIELFIFISSFEDVGGDELCVEEFAYVGVGGLYEVGGFRDLHHMSVFEHEYAVDEEERALKVVRNDN